MVIAVAALLHALVTHDFNIEYVGALLQQHAAAALHDRRAVGRPGRLAAVLAADPHLDVARWCILQNREKNRELMPYVTAMLMVVALFFLSLLVFVTPPFERLAFTPAEGRDLNPLLQNYWMTIHPPSLYIGYVGCAVPFAFAMAALATGKLGDVWIRTTRRWTLLAWFFLSLGNLFGARVGVRGARLGRLLGVGSGRERRLHAVAHLHRVPALGDDPGKEEHAEGVEHGAGDPHLRADHLRHVPDAQRRDLLGALVHAVGPRPVLHGLPRRHAGGVDRAALWRLPLLQQREPARLDALARVGVPAATT